MSVHIKYLKTRLPPESLAIFLQGKGTSTFIS